MNFPSSRLSARATHEGRIGQWLVLDLRGLDLDGVTELVIPMEAVSKVRSAPQTPADGDDPFARMRALLNDRPTETEADE